MVKMLDSTTFVLSAVAAAAVAARLQGLAAGFWGNGDGGG